MVIGFGNRKQDNYQSLETYRSMLHSGESFGKLLSTTTRKVDDVTNELITLGEVVAKHIVNKMCWLLLAAFNKVLCTLKKTQKRIG